MFKKIMLIAVFVVTMPMVNATTEEINGSVQNTKDNSPCALYLTHLERIRSEQESPEAQALLARFMQFKTFKCINSDYNLTPRQIMGGKRID